eukprot:TRINITY_DN757_c0_g1_i1.p3 TRINITY_DN757_c0_g1~~TRINITY_DN757_c0_g1_i1.p3  ORF type:complete len:59 (+),score=2.12 TRINITY_DN757_c0_g1_i1:703-879(+)
MLLFSKKFKPKIAIFPKKTSALRTPAQQFVWLGNVVFLKREFPDFSFYKRVPVRMKEV